MIIRYKKTPLLFNTWAINLGLKDGLWFGVRYLSFGKRGISEIESEYANGTYTLTINLGIINFSLMNLIFKEPQHGRVAKLVNAQAAI